MDDRDDGPPRIASGRDNYYCYVTILFARETQTRVPQNAPDLVNSVAVEFFPAQPLSPLRRPGAFRTNPPQTATSPSISVVIGTVIKNICRELCGTGLQNVQTPRERRLFEPRKTRCDKIFYSFVIVAVDETSAAHPRWLFSVYLMCNL